MRPEAIYLKPIYDSVIGKELIVHNDGHIYRVAKRGWDQWNKKVVTRKCKIVRAEHFNGKYLMIRVMINGVRRHFGAHRFVFYHFKGEIPVGMTINHIDGNKLNNHPDNLELATNSEQAIHRIRVLKNGFDQDGEKNSQSKLTFDQVKEIIKRRNLGEKLKSIANDFNVSDKHVSKLALRQRWKHIDKIQSIP